MNGIPLSQTNDPALITRGYNLGLKLVPNLIHELTVKELEYYERNLSELQDVVRRGLANPKRSETRVAETIRSPKEYIILNNTTGPTFWEWLEAREKLHKFLTGETVILRDMFEVSDELLARTDIMPFFRPAGATNRIALDWKVKLGMKKSYEEVDVMKYCNSEGPKVPELHCINRSIRPDENTLGRNSKSPDNLPRVIEGTIWTGLYGWSDADNLHYLINGIHLDSGETWTWFPDDRFQGNSRVAVGAWRMGKAQAGFIWYCRDYRDLCIGTRLAKSISLRSQS